MIEHLWSLLGDLWSYLANNFSPFRDTLDILIVTLAVYGLLRLIKGTRAYQIGIGLLLVIAMNLVSKAFGLVTVSSILDNFSSAAVLIIIVLFQHDIRRALARLGRGVFPTVSRHQEFQIIEEVVRATQTLVQKRLGALIVLERDTNLSDQIESGRALDAEVSKEILVSLFLTQSPLHDGAVVIQRGRVSRAGCILPLTFRDDLPGSVGTRHRAAVGLTEETDAVVVVVSEETAQIAVVQGGEMERHLEAPELREVLHDLFSGDRSDAPPEEPEATEEELPQPQKSKATPLSNRSDKAE